MAKGTDENPFPALNWDGWCWRGRCALPWVRSARGVDLLVRAACSDAAERTKPAAAPQPSAEQVAAVRLLLDPASPTAAALLSTLRANVPELPSADWDAVWGVLEIADAIVFTSATDGIAYTGFLFNGMGYEHGIGVVAHRDRVAHIGFAETADEAAAKNDLRRLKRASRGSG